MPDLKPTDIPRPGAARDPGVRARPVQIQDPRGQALGNAAQDIASIGVAFRELGEKRQEAEDRAFVDRFQLEYSKRAAAIETESVNSPDAARPDFPEFLDGRLAEAQAEAYEAVAAEGGYSPGERGKRAAESAALNMRTTTARRASVTVHNQRILHVASTTEQNTMAIARRAAGTGDLDGGLKRAEESVETLRSILAPDKFRAMQETARSQVIESVVLGHIERGELDQAKKIVNRYTGFAGEGADEVKQTVIAAAEAEGVDPMVLLAIADIESGFNPLAKNPRSTAAGVFQFLSSTGGHYGLPADARMASIGAQAGAGAKFTAANAAFLKRAFGSEPSPADLYLAHFLGAQGAVNVLGADGDSPVSAVLSKDVIAANPFLKNMTVADLWDWSKNKMQASMTKLAGSKVIDGRQVASNASALPIDAAVRLNGAINTQIEARRREEEKRQKELFNLIDPTKARKDRDPVTYVARQSEEAQAAYRDALESEREGDPAARTAMWERAGDVALSEQSALGVPEHAQKILPNQMAQTLTLSVIEAPTQQKAQRFYALAQSFGRHWQKVYGELVEQGLPNDYAILGFLDPHRNPAAVAAVSGVLGVSGTDLKSNLGSRSEIISDLLRDINDDAAEFIAAYSFGPFSDSVRGQAAGLLETLRKVGLSHFRQHGDLKAARATAAGIIDDHFEIVTGSKLRAILPADSGLVPGEIEAVTGARQRPEYLEAFNPIAPQSPFTPPSFLLKERLLRTAVNSGVWITNSTGDGLMLVVPVGDDAAVTLPLMNDAGQFYEIKFEEIPRILRELNPMLENPFGLFARPSTVPSE